MVLENRDLSMMLETAIVAARLAGQRAMEEISFVKASVKNSTELVTQADARCQQIIIDRIKETYPDHGFIAEEGERSTAILAVPARAGSPCYKQPPRGAEDIWWLIDPIDGTNNFAHKMLLFTVSIAAMYKGEPVAGVIFDPATESMFTAVQGGEAQLNGRRITVSEEKMDQFSSVGLDSHFIDEIPRWACEIMKRTRFRVIGSAALHLAYIAKGGLIADITQATKLWDIAAGVLIAENAGAVATDWQGGKIFPVDLNSYDSGKFKILTANKKVHAELLKLLSD